MRRGIPVLRWFQMLYGTFGTFLPLLMLEYGLQQGFTHKSELFACMYIMMDTLKLDGVTISRPLSRAKSDGLGSITVLTERILEEFCPRSASVKPL